jgi:UPF0755 protein
MKTADISSLFRVGLAGIAVLVVTFTLRFFASGVEAAPDYESGRPGREILVEIQPGESGSEIASKLEELNVVKSSLAFFRVAVADQRSGRIAPGEHRLQTKIPAQEALNQLLDPARIPNLIVIRDGERLSEIEESMIGFGLSRSEVRKAFVGSSPPSVFSATSLEGFLYPAQYSFNQGVSADEVVESMLAKFRFATKDVQWRYGTFSPYDLLTIASLVQTEGTPDVFGKVARVIFNRIEKGMPLQFDSTVHYALNRRGEIRVSIADTKVQNRYNTFIYRGLPPGPIGSPTRKAIDATLNPDVGDWLYFVTVKPKETRFTSSYDEFLNWKAEYKRNFKAGLFE